MAFHWKIFHIFVCFAPGGTSETSPLLHVLSVFLACLGAGEPGPLLCVHEWRREAGGAMDTLLVATGKFPAGFTALLLLLFFLVVEFHLWLQAYFDQGPLGSPSDGRPL